ncbi:MAG: hypothetical protein IKH92_02395 [Clostridiales bacterium]|nr:hypothetical protein [Clostridiales bacterium]
MKVVDSLKTEKSIGSRSISIRANSVYRAALIYLTLPVIIFFFGYLKIWWAILFSLVLGGGAFLAMRDFGKKDGELPNLQEKTLELKPSCIIFLLIVLPIILYWGGIGEFGCCSEDHRVRFAILNDLVEYKWPVVYDFSTQQNPAVAASLGSGTAAFAYYFVFWMIPALFGKIFGLLVARIVLVIWSGIGLVLVFFGASFLYKRFSRALFIFLILFAGFDVIPYVINRIIGVETTWEGWNSHLFIHGNFFQIMNVFNQSIPGWLITILLLMAKDGRSIGLLGGLMFCYSPWATIGIFPMCICKLILTSRIEGENGKKLDIKTLLKNTFTPVNIIPPIIVLVVFGLLYTANPNATGDDGFIWKFYASPLGLFVDYIKYVIFEFGIWLLLIYKRHKKDPMLWTAVGTLLVLPIYKISVANDFIMRGSMAPAFLIGLYAVMLVTDNFEMCRDNKLELKKALAGRAVLLIMCVAAYIPVNYMLYTGLISYQMHFTDEVNYIDEVHMIGSFGNIIEESELEVVQKQFYVYDYEDTAFFKYLAK